MTGAEFSEPHTPAGRAGLAALRRAPATALVGLDFDGTLAPIVADPDDARAAPGAVAALAGLAAVVGRVVIITGRPAAVAAEYGGFAGAPGLAGLAILGHYGRERWDPVSGETTGPPPDPGVARVRAELPGLLSDAGIAAYVEDKGSALAVHTRRLADPEAALLTLRAPLEALAGRSGLVVEPGRHVLELRPPGADKGAALRTLLEETPASAVVFVGDDLGDLTAFDAVDALRAVGVPGLLVCSGSPEVSALAERADLVVDGPAGVVAWLAWLTNGLAPEGA